MLRVVIAPIAAIGTLMAAGQASAADLYADERYYDAPYEYGGATQGSRAHVYGGASPAPPSYPPYPPPGYRSSYEPVPYEADPSIAEPRAGLYGEAPPPYPPADDRRTYEPLPYDAYRAIPRPQVGVYEGARAAPEPYPPSAYGHAYEPSVNCGIYRYWDGQRCLSARYAPRYPGSRL